MLEPTAVTYKGRHLHNLTMEELRDALDTVISEYANFRRTVAEGYRLDAELQIDGPNMRAWAQAVMGAGQHECLSRSRPAR